MTNDSPLKPLTARDDEPTMVIVESQPFVDFDQWMDGQLDNLVARWIHLAAPNAARVRRVSSRLTE
jgi:hypothetical protein